MDDLHKRIGKRLRKHRKLMGFSQLEVADRLNLESSALISRWEKGIALPSMENAMKLSKLYKTLLNELFWDLDRMCGAKLFPNDSANKKKRTRCNDP